ncbi:hypothetical protein A5706_09710 [Mycobacterium sp. E796]|nr:hypothetical protein A5706_09710 [Mycobacterium sp. E796]
MVAAALTTSVLPAAGDEESVEIARVFSEHGASHQALTGQATAFQEQFVQHLTAGAFSYAGIEARLAQFLPAELARGREPDCQLYRHHPARMAAPRIRWPLTGIHNVAHLASDCRHWIADFLYLVETGAITFSPMTSPLWPGMII